MAWEFETDPAFQKDLDWIDQFVREEVEPLDLILNSPYDVHNPVRNRIVKPLQAEVKKRGLWACHLGPELGGPGYGQVKLALMNELLGRSHFAPTIFGCQAPDSGNAEILAHYGTPAQKKRYLEPLLANDIVSCFAMTEPHGGSDPRIFTTRAVHEGDQWVISGKKWFASSSNYASFFITMAVTDPEVSAYKGMSMFILPVGTPGLETVREPRLAGRGHDGAAHGYIRFNDVRVPADHMLGGPGEAFVVASNHAGARVAEGREAFADALPRLPAPDRAHPRTGQVRGRDGGRRPPLKDLRSPCGLTLQNPTNTTASSGVLRGDTTALAGKLSSGQPIATHVWMTWSAGMPASARTTGDCMMPWLLITQPRPRDQAALTRQLTTPPQSKAA